MNKKNRINNQIIEHTKNKSNKQKLEYEFGAEFEPEENIQLELQKNKIKEDTKTSNKKNKSDRGAA